MDVRFRDSRWRKLASDARYRRSKVKRVKNTPQTDSRFSDAFKSKSKFSNQVKTDKHGKKKTDETSLENYYQLDKARGENMSESSSSSSSEEELEEDKNWSEVTSKFIEETKKHQHETSDATCRLALVNLDWSKVKARDQVFQKSLFF